MFNRQQRRWSVPLTIATLTIVADQASKLWVVQNLGPETMARKLTLIDDWLNIVYSHNTGIAFSMLQGQTSWLALSSLLITLGAIYFYWRHLPNLRPLPQLIIGLIVGGGLGNLIDRVRLGYVVDFIQVGWFPIFNVADSAVCTGAALLMLLFLRDELSPSGDTQQAISA